MAERLPQPQVTTSSVMELSTKPEVRDPVARFGYVIRCPRPLTHLPDSSGHRLHSEQGGELILISNSPVRYFGGADRVVGARNNAGRTNRVSADRVANVRSYWHPIYSDEHVDLHDLPKKAG